MAAKMRIRRGRIKKFAHPLPRTDCCRSPFPRRDLRRRQAYNPVLTNCVYMLVYEKFTSTFTARCLYFTSKTFDCFYLQIRVAPLRSTAESSLRRRLLVCKGFGQLGHALQIGEE